MKMKLDEIPVSKFEYLAYDRLFVAEASSLTGYNTNRHMYDDSEDLGFIIVNEKTGNKVEFVLTDVEINDDNEVICWDYISVNPVKNNLLYVKIFND